MRSQGPRESLDAFDVVGELAYVTVRHKHHDHLTGEKTAS
jgi:hypothetical protein